MGQCVPGSTTCSGISSAPICGVIAGNSAVQTCGVTALWGTPWPCASGTCSGGACTGSTTSGTSCEGLSGPGLDDCGASSESCCTSLEVPGGTYYRTYTNSGTGATGLWDRATVSGFRLDKYLVTVGRFRQFVDAWNGGAAYVPPAVPAAGSGKHTHLNGGSGLNATGGGYEPGWVATDDSSIALTDTNLNCGVTWTPSPGTQETLPIDCVNWYEAYAFCIWDEIPAFRRSGTPATTAGFLPSEAEWEYAAAGGSQQREYPWGSADPGMNNQYAIYGGYYDTVSTTLYAPVGTATLGAGLWGQLDLSGELSEWTLDWYAAYVQPCMNCADTTAGDSRVARGGDAFDFVLPGPMDRNGNDSQSHPGAVGFRCARTP